MLKKCIIALFAIQFFILFEVHATNKTSNNSSFSPMSISNYSTQNINLDTGKKTKDGRYKRKKGFMWGLFKKKSACDCPKH